MMPLQKLLYTHQACTSNHSARSAWPNHESSKPLRHWLLRAGLLSLILNNLQHTIVSLAVKDSRDRNLSNQVTRDLSTSKRVFSRHNKRACLSSRLQTACSHNDPRQATGAEVLLRLQLLIQHSSKGIGELESRIVLLSPCTSIGEDGRNHNNLLHACLLGSIHQRLGAQVLHCTCFVGPTPRISARNKTSGDDQGVCTLQRCRQRLH
mmetsp:Transcript_2517/g.5524  ORF Transcript_2517/g.5524 Transcript_2517/m.5524 type:complete len:208 (+) Transcript_2517:24-647(+)